MVQLLAIILVYGVFIMLFIALAIYLGVAASTYIKQRKEKHSVTLHGDSTSMEDVQTEANPHITRTITTQHSATITKKEEI
jgi:hypothetical protein